MDDYLSESEQWEQVKGWLLANGPWIVAGVAAGALAIGGWRWWQSHTNAMAVTASNQYQQVLSAFNAGAESRGLALIGDLERAHAGSPYVDQANLAAARVMVDTNELQRAARRLEDVVRESHDPQLATIALLRLARVQISLGKPDVALATLGAPLMGAFAPRYHEIRGDAYYAKGDKAAALDEYRAARLAAGPALAENDVLDLKINDLTGAIRAAGQASGAAHPNAAAQAKAAAAAQPGSAAHAAHSAPAAAAQSAPSASRAPR
ncbi:MAG: YfgM family protein [Steroidobacteraceae bacterium]